MQKLDLTKAPILKSLLSLSWPIILAHVLHTVYNLIDTFWVGRLGAEAVAAVSIGFPVIFLVLSLGIGMSIAGTILVAQYKGKGDLNKMNHVAAQTFLVMFFISIVLSIVGWFLAEPFLHLLGAPIEIIPDAVSYIRILFFGMFLLFIYFVFQALMRGVGDVITPMVIVLLSVVLNAILDPIFILGWGPIPAYGVAGAAIVTVFTEGLGALIGLLMLFSGKYGVHLKVKDIKLDFKLIKKMAKLGAPASFEEVFRSVTIFFLFYLVAKYGTETMAAFGIGIRILSFAIIPAAGLAIATTTLVGQNVGAKKIDRAARSTWYASGIGFFSLTFMGILIILFAKPVATFFVPGEETVIQLSVDFLQIMALSFGFICVEHVFLGAIKGAGETFPAMILNVLTKVFLLVPIAWFLSNTYGINGIWWTYPITYFLASFIMFGWFVRGSWKNQRVIEESPFYT